MKLFATSALSWPCSKPLPVIAHAVTAVQPPAEIRRHLLRQAGEYRRRARRPYSQVTKIGERGYPFSILYEGLVI